MMLKRNIIKLLAAFFILNFAGPYRINAQYDTTLLKNAVAEAEKLYIISDRQVYVTGDSIRYRVFLTGADLRAKKNLSTIVYLDLSGPRESSRMDWRINLSNGSASGVIAVPQGMATGMYKLRAHTRWMMNGSSDYYFSSDIMLINVSDEQVPSVNIPARPQTRRIGFYPEGGSMVEDAENHIGYMLTGTLMPDSILITDNDSIVKLILRPDESGFGAFMLIPERGHLYRAQMYYPDNVNAGADLPRPSAYGTTIHVENSSDASKVTIISKPQREGESQLLHLTALSRGIIFMDTVFSSSQTVNEVYLRKNPENEGLVLLNLYDSRRFLLAERLFYNSPAGLPQIAVKEVRGQYEKDEDVSFSLSLEDTDMTDTAYMTVTVTKALPLKYPDVMSGITSYMLLQSEISSLPVSLKEGYLENGKIQDLLLCTDGSDYAWNYVKNTGAEVCAHEKEISGAIIKGRLLDKSGKPLPSVNLILGVTDSIHPALIYSRTAEDGSFRFLADSVYDNRDIIIQAMGVNSNDLVWDMEKTVNDYAPYDTAAYFLTPAERQFISDTRNIYLAKRIYMPQKAGSAPSSMQGGLNLFLRPDMVIYPADFSELVNFREINDNILPSVRFTTRNKIYSTAVFNRSSGLWLENDMMLLNGVVFRDLAYIATLGTRDIERIEVVNSNIFLGSMTFGGFVSVYTHDNKIPDNYLKTQTLTFTNKVGQSDTDIIANKPVTTGSQFPDFSQNLYWAPELKMTANENIRVDFRTSLLEGDYIINIQGITKNGNPVSKQIKFQVK